MCDDHLVDCRPMNYAIIWATDCLTNTRTFDSVKYNMVAAQYRPLMQPIDMVCNAACSGNRHFMSSRQS